MKIVGTILARLLIIIILVVTVLGLAVVLIDSDGTWYETEDPAQYLVIQHNGDNGPPEAFFTSFFPSQIQPCFENVVYKYKANDWCEYNCEMYLEFTVSNQEQFQRCVTELTQGLTAQTFPYNDKYDDYLIINNLYVEPSSSSEPGNERYYFIMGARMGRILVCREEQRIICQGILIRGCCGGYAEDYDFYTRFGIHPQEYSDRFCNDDEYE